MNEKRKMWFGTFAALFVVIILAISFIRFYVNKDFITYDFASCDPLVSSCFVKVCDETDPRCNTQMTEDGLYYFSVQEKQNTALKEYFCSEETLEQLSEILFDTTCSL